MGKVWVSISQTFPISWVLLHFGILWEIYGETHAFPMCLSIPQDENRMGKKHSYYGKSMSINLSDFPHTMGFVAFYRIVRNLWGNPCISHMMTLVNSFPVIQHNSSTNLNKKVFLRTVSCNSLLVMISSSLISCMCKLFLERKKVYNFSLSINFFSVFHVCSF